MFEPATVNIIIIKPDCTCSTQATSSLAASSSSSNKDSCDTPSPETMVKMDVTAPYYYTAQKATSLVNVKFLKKYIDVSLQGYGSVTYILPQITNQPKDKDGFSTCGTEVTVTVTEVLPVWPAGSFQKLSQDAQKEWQRFVSALKVHEDGHVTGAVQFFPKYFKESTLIGKNMKEANRILEEAKLHYKLDVSDPYDALTRHGETQGAVLRKIP
ncbi:MAG: DUF922 domain-containing protein [Nitrososphaeraceae archaeon]